MRQAELRKVERIKLSVQPKGALLLIVKDVHYPVLSVLDISSEGIRVQLQSPVIDLAEVTIQYRHDDINVSVNGTVVWNSPANERTATEVNNHSYNVGIDLLAPHLLFSLMQT